MDQSILFFSVNKGIELLQWNLYKLVFHLQYDQEFIIMESVQGYTSQSHCAKL